MSEPFVNETYSYTDPAAASTPADSTESTSEQAKPESGRPRDGEPDTKAWNEQAKADAESAQQA